MNIAQLGGIARAKSLSGERRRSIARKAARARWDSGLVQLSEIKRQVTEALSDRLASAYLFGSYACHKATPHSDIDLMVVLDSPDANWFDETAVIRGRLNFGRPIDLIVIDDATYQVWKKEEDSVQYEVAKKGVRLV
jgi:predicted nucleotidyltransferase